jgi:hypothetical protein
MATAKRLIAVAATASLALGVYLYETPTADACGCFVPPDPSVPIVQAGERILFSHENGIVEAHIQIQYNAEGGEQFGWLVPVPAVPEVTLGTDELFTQLINTTQPLYRLDREYVGNCPFDPARGGGGGFGGAPSNDSSGEGTQEPGDPQSPLVVQDSVGPFGFAVLRSDSMQPMLDWLSENGYFVPAGTDEAIAPYITPGGYFLALKLEAGNDAGDIQPIVLTYESDLPMIPIVATSVAATPDMAVQVWSLGESRAIPRNYYHTRVNDAKLDWINGAQNYADVITDAVDEAEGHHSFVTEYAGSSAVMVDQLDPSWRFGDLSQLAGITDAVGYIEFLNQNGFQIIGSSGQPPFFTPTYGSQILAILGRHLPVPQGLLDVDVTPSDYYNNIGYYLGFYKEDNPEQFVDLDTEFDPYQLTLELEERIVDPSVHAGKLFRKHSYLTRMFTTLSPEEMTKDPVFSFNPDLPSVSNNHTGRLVYFCGLIPDDSLTTTPAVLVTADGWELNYPNGTGGLNNNGYNKWVDVEMPHSHFTQVLREEGNPDNVSDNTDAIFQAINAENNGGGCSTGGSSGPLGAVIIFGLIALAGARRRRA